ncbi:MAG: hypothetical protein KKH83_06225 [Candidatus Margulisbacteria bacterium]|nr:hypothetical protein [Candidatus Margulisiibacteriota bacterium]
MSQPWALHIDIEGFSKLFLENKRLAIKLLRGLVEDIHKIGTNYYCKPSNRLFVYQFGDAFMISSYNGNIVQSVALAIVLLRSTLLRGGTAKATISFGEMADIQEWYSEEIRQSSKMGVIPLGDGLLVIQLVMGEALINCHDLSKKVSGPLLIIDDKADIDSLTKKGFIIQKNIVPKDKEQKLTGTGIDWIHSTNGDVNSLLSMMDKSNDAKELEKALKKYIENNKTLNNKTLTDWNNNAKKLLENMGGSPARRSSESEGGNPPSSG